MVLGIRITSRKSLEPVQSNYWKNTLTHKMTGAPLSNQTQFWEIIIPPTRKAKRVNLNSKGQWMDLGKVNLQKQDTRLTIWIEWTVIHNQKDSLILMNHYLRANLFSRIMTILVNLLRQLMNLNLINRVNIPNKSTSKKKAISTSRK